MLYEMPKCKITVIKRLINQDLADEYLDVAGDFEACDRFSDGQEIVVEHPFSMPEGFCAGAWADIRADIHSAMQDPPGSRESEDASVPESRAQER